MVFEMAVRNWIYGVSDVNDARKIKIMGAKWDSDALDESYYARNQHDYVSGVYMRCNKAELVKRIEHDGWEYVNGIKVEGKVKPVPHVKKTKNDVPIIKRELDL